MAMELLIPVLILGVMGLIFGAGLALAAKIFEVKTDERVPLVRAALPGANCGGCGYPGCDALAAAMVKGDAAVNACPVGGAATALNIGDIMGESAGANEPVAACVLCKGDCENAPTRADYYGVRDCREALIANGGIKKCRYGCIGFGTCVNACMFGALSMGENGLPTVDVDKCTACGKCKSICPKGIIDLIPSDQLIHVDCRSKDKGKFVRNNCTVGCIGCKACIKVCEEDAIIVENNLASINYDKCIQCGACVEKCPTGAITYEDRIIIKEDVTEIEMEPESDLSDEVSEIGEAEATDVKVEVMEEIVTIESPEIKIAEIADIAAVEEINLDLSEIKFATIDGEESISQVEHPNPSHLEEKQQSVKDKDEIEFKITDL